MNFIIWIVVGGLLGWIASMIMRTDAQQGMFLNVVVGIIGALKVFAIAYVATGGGPADATWFYIIHLYQQAFGNLELGYASALAWGFCAAVLALTLLQFRLFRRRLQYG